MTKISCFISLGIMLMIGLLRLGKYLFAIREKRLLAQMPHLDEIEVREDCYKWYDGFVLRSAGVIGALVVSCL